MTVPSENSKIQHIGDGVTATWPYPYVFFGATTLLVTILSANGLTETTKTIVTHYNVSGGAGADGVAQTGSITFTPGNIPAVGETITISRKEPFTQIADYIPNDTFPSETNEGGLDKSAMRDQQLLEQLNRCLKFPISDPVLTTQLLTAAARAGKVLSFDTAGNMALVSGFGTWRGTWATATAYNVGDIVKDGAAGANTGNYYYCVLAHTSGTWATDLAAPKWVIALDVSPINTAVAAAAASASAAATSATNSANSATASDNASRLTLNAQSGTSYTLVLSDANKLIECTNASAITLTVPTNASVAFPLGTQIAIAQGGAGQITITQPGGVTLLSTYGRLKTETQEGMVFLVKQATNTWRLTGNLTS